MWNIVSNYVIIISNKDLLKVYQQTKNIYFPRPYLIIISHVYSMNM